MIHHSQYDLPLNQHVISSPVEVGDENSNFSSLNTVIQSLVFQSLPSFREDYLSNSLKAIKDKIKSLASFSKENVSTQIEEGFQDLQKVKENILNITNTAASSSSTQTTLIIVQIWVSDCVLKGGAFVAKSGLPFIMHASTLEHLNPTTEYIKFFTDLLDAGAGTLGIIYKSRILDAAQEEINKLKSHSTILQPQQFANLKQLEKMVVYERSLLPLQTTEQAFRVIRNFFSYATFALSWIAYNPLSETLTQSANALIGGLNVSLYGLFFYKARQALQAHRSWSQDFKGWIKQNTFIITKQEGYGVENDTHMQILADQLKAKRLQRHENQLKHVQTLKDKIASKELQLEVVVERIKAFKREGMQKTLTLLKVQEISPKDLQAKLEETWGISIEPALIDSLKNAYLHLHEIKKEENPEHLALVKAQKEIVQQVEKCVASWMQQQSTDSLLSVYVDYHSVLDPIIKSSLTAMVKKKHHIEKGFLAVKRNFAGIRLTVSSVIVGVALTLAIMGLVSTPVGAAGLILLILGCASFALTMGLMGAGYYYAHQQKPGLTAANLKGAYAQLFFYNSIAKVMALQEQIGEYIETAWREKSTQLTTYTVEQLPFFHRPSVPVLEGPLNEQESTVKKHLETDLQESQSQAQAWKHKAVALQEELEVTVWKDFARQADLKVADKNEDLLDQQFDTLETLQQALSQADLNLLSSETKELLEGQLGINIHSLQDEIEKDPLAIRKALREFFNFDDIAFVKFVGQQQTLKSTL